MRAVGGGEGVGRVDDGDDVVIVVGGGEGGHYSSTSSTSGGGGGGTSRARLASWWPQAFFFFFPSSLPSPSSPLPPPPPPLLLPIQRVVLDPHHLSLQPLQLFPLFFPFLGISEGFLMGGFGSLPTLVGPLDVGAGEDLLVGGEGRRGC